MKKWRFWELPQQVSNSSKNTEPVIQERMWLEVIVEGLFRVKNTKEALHFMFCIHLYSEKSDDWRFYTIFGNKYVSIEEEGAYS